LFDEMGEREIAIDGIFGAKTRATIRRLQERRGIPESGEVDQTTWWVLAFEAPLSVVDAVDMTDVNLWPTHLYVNDGTSHVVDSFGASRGGAMLIDRLLTQHPAHSVALLRIHGHGTPGHQYVASGTDSESSSAFSAGHFNIPEAVADYRRLGTIMKPYGSIELRGCHVAVGRNGRMLLSGMAHACGVPVTAAFRSQYGGYGANRFEGPTLTCFPDDTLTLTSWAQRVFSQCQW